MVITTQLSSTTAPADPFARIVGQRNAVKLLREIREGISYGFRPLPLLLLGPTGHGKTALAKALAESMEVDFFRIDCGLELKSEEIVRQLVSHKRLAVVFCDEMQSMNKHVQEVLYQAIDVCLVPAVKHGRIDRCAERVPIEPFMLIGATNEPGRLKTALLNRMIQVVLEDYSGDDLVAIVEQTARQFNLVLSGKAVDRLVRASNGSPRKIRQCLELIELKANAWRSQQDRQSENADLADDLIDGILDQVGSRLGDLISDASGKHDDPMSSRCTSGTFTSGRPSAGQPCIPDELVEQALSTMGIDQYGLDYIDRKLLTVIAQRGRAPAELLSQVIGFDIAFTRETLARLRFKQLTDARRSIGWTLTDKGKDIVKKLGLDR